MRNLPETSCKNYLEELTLIFIWSLWKPCEIKGKKKCFISTLEWQLADSVFKGLFSQPLKLHEEWSHASLHVHLNIKTRVLHRPKSSYEKQTCNTAWKVKGTHLKFPPNCLVLQCLQMDSLPMYIYGTRESHCFSLFIPFVCFSNLGALTFSIWRWWQQKASVWGPGHAHSFPGQPGSSSRCTGDKTNRSNGFMVPQGWQLSWLCCDSCNVLFFFNVKPQARGLRGCWLFFEENEFPVLFFVKKSFKL